ncbi:MAG: secondary thiamine-phosphate synthase enzyme YjbQ [Bacteroidota bacterium]
MITQKEFSLPPFPRGFHLITSHIISKADELPETGMVHLFVRHTSAALTLNENADPTVRSDFEAFISKLIPENDPVYEHLLEGADDMPAHIKSSLFGQGIWIPVTRGRLNLGTWQGIYLCEFRNHGGSRKIVMTVLS